jgi:hypothetical protein
MERIKRLGECTRSISAIKLRETHTCVHLISKSKSLKHQQSSSRKTRTNIHLRGLDSTTPRGSTWQTRTSDSYYNECQYQQISKTAATTTTPQSTRAEKHQPKHSKCSPRLADSQPRNVRRYGLFLFRKHIANALLLVSNGGLVHSKRPDCDCDCERVVL